MLEAAFLDPSLEFEGVDSATIVRSGPFEYRLAGVQVDSKTRRLSTFQGGALPITMERKLISLGLTMPPPETHAISGEYLGFRLLAKYRALIYEKMKTNQFMVQLPNGLPPQAEARAVAREILLRCAIADACTAALRMAPPGIYTEVLANIQRSSERHATSLSFDPDYGVAASTPAHAIAQFLDSAAREGPTQFAATLLPLMAGENVRGAAATDEPCLYDLFRHTPAKVVAALKDPSASPFRLDPRGPVEMIAALGPSSVPHAEDLEERLVRVVGEIDEMYRSCLDG